MTTNRAPADESLEQIHAAIRTLATAPETSRWLADKLFSALNRDAVDAANDADFLAGVLQRRSGSIQSAATPEGAEELARVEAEIQRVSADPAASNWLKSALSTGLHLAPSDVARESEALASVLQRRADAIVQEAMRCAGLALSSLA